MFTREWESVHDLLKLLATYAFPLKLFYRNWSTYSTDL